MQGKGAATIAIFGLKNMAPDDWADKQQVDHGGEVIFKTVYEGDDASG